jgi:hypothetical protein
MENEMPEMELEKLEAFIKLMDENKKDQLILVGQINFLTETSCSVDVVVSTWADYNGKPIILSWKEEVGREILPENDEDEVRVSRMKKLEEKIREKKRYLKDKLNEAGFDVQYGVWK